MLVLRVEEFIPEFKFIHKHKNNYHWGTHLLLQLFPILTFAIVLSLILLNFKQHQQQAAYISSPSVLGEEAP